MQSTIEFIINLIGWPASIVYWNRDFFIISQINNFTTRLYRIRWCDGGVLCVCVHVYKLVFAVLLYIVTNCVNGKVSLFRISIECSSSLFLHLYCTRYAHKYTHEFCDMCAYCAELLYFLRFTTLYSRYILSISRSHFDSFAQYISPFACSHLIVLYIAI